MIFVTGICWIFIKHLLGSNLFFHGIILVQAAENCFPPEYVCREPFWVLGRAGQVSCVYATGQIKTHHGAVQLCKTNSADLFRMDGEDPEDVNLVERLMHIYHSSGYWVRKTDGIDGICNTFAQFREIELIPCDEQFDVLCEKKATLHKQERPLLKIVKNKGLGTQLYQDTEVQLSCDVKGENVKNLSIAYGQMNNKQSPAQGEFEREVLAQVSGSGEECGVRTITSFTHMTSPADNNGYFFCFFSGSINSCSAQGSNDQCAIQGPFQIINPPAKPVITLKPSKAPNIVFYGKSLKAECTTQVDIGSKIEWAYVVDNHLTHLRHTKTTVRIYTKRSSTNWVSTLLVQTEGKTWKGKQVTLVCYSRSDSIIKCENSHYWCQTADVQIESGANIPYLRIYYDRAPNVIYAGGTLEARCTTDKAERIDWLKMVKVYERYTMVLIANNTGADRKEDEPIYEIINEKYGPNEEYEMSILRIKLVSRDINDAKIGCFAPKTPIGVNFVCDLEENCVYTPPIKVLDGPLPPSLTLVFDRKPNYMYVDNTLLVQCDAHVGSGGTIELLLYVNDSIFSSSYDKLGIQIVSVGAGHGGYMTKLLRIKRISAALNGMMIGCFSYDIAAYPNRHLLCRDWDELCYLTQPIRIIYKTELKFSFGEDKIGKYVLIWFLWMLVVVFVHCYSWYGPGSGVGGTRHASIWRRWDYGGGFRKEANPLDETELGLDFKFSKQD